MAVGPWPSKTAAMLELGAPLDQFVAVPQALVLVVLPVPPQVVVCPTSAGLPSASPRTSEPNKPKRKRTRDRLCIDIEGAGGRGIPVGRIQVPGGSRVYAGVTNRELGGTNEVTPWLALDVAERRSRFVE